MAEREEAPPEFLDMGVLEGHNGWVTSLICGLV